MALRIANPAVAGKIERLAQLIGLTKTAAVEKAVDRLLAESARPELPVADRVARLLAELDRIPDTGTSAAALDWDEHGLPR